MTDGHKKLLFGCGCTLAAVLLLCLCAFLPGQFLLWTLLAMVALIPAAEDLSLLSGLAVYAAAAILSLLLPILESALPFALLGYYSILRPRIDTISIRSLRTGIRIAMVTVSSTLLFLVMRFFFGSELSALTGGGDALLLAILLVLGALYFLLYNFVLDRCTIIYQKRIRPKLWKS